jgi:hypothetical protein
MVDCTPKWCKEIDFVTKSSVDTVINMCNTLKNDLPILPIPENLSAKPGASVTFLSKILTVMENDFYQTSDEDKKPRLYSLLPIPSLRWKYLLINTKSLCSNITNIKYSSGYLEEQRLYHDVFNFSCFGYET